MTERRAPARQVEVFVDQAEQVLGVLFRDFSSTKRCHFAQIMRGADLYHF